MSMITVIETAIGVLMLVFGVLAISCKKRVTSVIFLSIISMLAVVAFVIMRAPDVAITEAVIGSGLVTAVFLFTLYTVRKEGETR